MDAEQVLDIVLGSILAAGHIIVTVWCIVWRLRHYHKGLHHSTAGFSLLFFSFLLGGVLPIEGFTYLDGGTAGTKSLIVAMVFCPFMLVLAFHEICYCIYIDEFEAVERRIIREIRIDLRGEDVFIDDREPWTSAFWISISSEQKTISFNSRRMEGDIPLFVNSCKSIHKSQ